MSVLNVDSINVNTISSSTGSTALTIDSSGRVISPNRPSFFAYNVTDDQNVTNNNVIQMTGVNDNNGNHYDSVNSRFIAPTRGRYFFWVSLLMDSAAVYPGDGRFWKNGSSTGRAFYANGDQTASLRKSVGMTIFELEVNDYVDIRSVGTNQYWGNATTSHTQWGGFLL